MSPEGSAAAAGSIDEPPSAGVASLLSASVEHLQREPVLWLQRLNLLLDRGRDADIAQAQAELRLMLGQFAGEGLRWQLLTLGCELALRANDYIGAQAHIEELTALHDASAGSFDLTPVLIFQARVSWERGSYGAALDDLSKTNPLRPDDACRVANWRARSLAALGDIAGALQASESGRRTADQFDLQGGLAYSLALSGQYELYRGNMIRGRRHLDRALHVSGEAQELRVRPQILTTLAEVDLIEGRLEDARNRMSEALHALAARPRRIWDSAYWSLTQARIHRRSLDWDAACSAARTLAYEAGFVSTKAPRHPVVSALHAEAATCWMAAGYEHQASLALAEVDWSRSDWVTLLQRDLVLTVVSTEDPEVYASRADSILQRAIQGGAPYVAVEMAFELAVRANRRWSWLAADLASWTYSAAESRGWKRVSRAAAPIAAGRGGPVEETRGSIVRDSRGVSTLFAPPRGQRPARGESAPPLPDPFDREATS
jgi:tetratricopeptide (TPR) repeat protein